MRPWSPAAQHRREARATPRLQPCQALHGLAARSAFALPLDQRANWIFRFTESDAARSAQSRAVDCTLTILVVRGPVTLSAPLLWVALGPRAIVAAIVASGVGLLWIHVLMTGWRRIPFTCPYLPGKRFVGQTVLVGLTGFFAFTTLGTALVHIALGGAGRALVATGTCMAAAYALRRHRQAWWIRAPLMFDDELPDRPVQLGL